MLALFLVVLPLIILLPEAHIFLFSRKNPALFTQVEEFHRRDGFEVGNADKIFESTSRDQLSRKVA